MYWMARKAFIFGQMQGVLFLAGNVLENKARYLAAVILLTYILPQDEAVIVESES